MTRLRVAKNRLGALAGLLLTLTVAAPAMAGGMPPGHPAPPPTCVPAHPALFGPGYKSPLGYHPTNPYPTPKPPPPTCGCPPPKPPKPRKPPEEKPPKPPEHKPPKPPEEKPPKPPEQKPPKPPVPPPPVTPTPVPTGTPTSSVAGTSVQPPTVLPGTITLTKWTRPSAQARRPIPFRITVKNVGPGVARDVWVSDRIPAGTSVLNPPRGATLRGGFLRWRVGDLAPGRSLTLGLWLRTDTNKAQRLCNTARAVGANVPRVLDTACTRVSPVHRPRPPRVTG